MLNPQPEPKGPWTPEEDKRLADLVALHGACRWSMLATEFEGRDGKQVRERWHSYLDPEIKRAPWSAEENATIIALKQKLGSKWYAPARGRRSRAGGAGRKSLPRFPGAPRTP